MNKIDFKYMIESMTADLAELLSDKLRLNISDSLDILYNSDTYAKLNNPETGLYYQSPLYVFSYLESELNTGKLS